MGRNKRRHIPISSIVEELLLTELFREIKERNGWFFTHRLAIWIVRYVLVISSLKESFDVELEEILVQLHGEAYKGILHITEEIFNSLQEEDNRDMESHLYLQSSIFKKKF